MTQVQETLKGEAQTVVLESHFDARKEVESRTLFERLTFRGEATPRVEAQTLVAEQGVPNLTQGVDAGEKRGGGAGGVAWEMIKGYGRGIKEGAKDLLRGVKQLPKGAFELLKFLGGVALEVPGALLNGLEWTINLPFRFLSMIPRIPLTIVGGVIKGVGQLTYGLSQMVKAAKWFAGPAAIILAAVGTAFGEPISAAYFWSVVGGGIAGSLLLAKPIELAGKAVYAIGGTLTYTSKKIGDWARGHGKRDYYGDEDDRGIEDFIILEEDPYGW